jgi:hypothetical protein
MGVSRAKRKVWDGNMSTFVETKLRALCDNVAIDNDQGASIIVKPIAVTALLICIEINSTALSRGFLNESKSCLELS